MGRCTYSEGKSILSNYQNKIDEAIYEIQTNYQDMDLKNSSIQTEIGEVIEKMVLECQSLKSYINDIHLR